MLERKIYKNPPLIEALCEVYFSETQNDLTLFGKFEDSVREDYPEKRELKNIGFEENFSPENFHSKQIDNGLMMRFSKSDNSELIQITQNLLTFNKLKPYAGYEDFKSNFSNVFDKYLGLSKPKYSERIGVRYIDRVVIDESDFRLQDYFNFSFNFADEEFGFINAFSIDVQITPKHNIHRLLFSLKSIQSTEEGKLEFLLDMYDTFEAHKIVDKDFILNTLDEAHENVEHLFEGVITEKTRELFGVKQ
jgi:uncharacterized protein (TIGR04255 family)